MLTYTKTSNEIGSLPPIERMSLDRPIAERGYLVSALFGIALIVEVDSEELRRPHIDK